MTGKEFDVLVVGGGHSGLLLAHGLAVEGIDVGLVDLAPPDRGPTSFDGRALALMYGSKKVFDRLGAWDPVRPHATPVEGVRVQDVTSLASARYDAREVGDHPFAYGILNHDLRRALYDLIRGDGKVAWLMPDRPLAIHSSARGVVVELGSGRSVRADLVVGADGRSSSVRRLAGIRTERWSYRRTALTFAVRHERPHDGLVREFLRPEGPLALLPIGPRLTSVTWVDRPEVASWLSGADGLTVIERLAEETDQLLGPMQLEGEVKTWPLEGHLAPRPVGPRAALVGDAAHGLHPIHAQGFNLGVRDIAVLIGLLVAARSAGRDLGASELLLDYARRRSNDTRFVVGLTDGLARLFSSDLPPARLIRGLGLSLVDAIPPLKAMAMRRGMGLEA